MGKLLKEAFPTNHREIRCKFGTIFLVYEVFLVSRFISYCLALFTDHIAVVNDIALTPEYLIFYATEIILILFLSYISLKSSQDQGDGNTTLIEDKSKLLMSVKDTMKLNETNGNNPSGKLDIIDLRNSIIKLGNVVSTTNSLASSYYRSVRSKQNNSS